MPVFKAPNNDTFRLDDETKVDLLPPGCVEITEDELAEILASRAEISQAVPEVVTMRQARLALLQFGMLAQVNTAVANMPGAQGDAARIEWEYAQEVRRDSPLVAALSVALGLTDETLDNLYKVAAGL